MNEIDDTREVNGKITESNLPETNLPETNLVLDEYLDEEPHETAPVVAQSQAQPPTQPQAQPFAQPHAQPQAQPYAQPQAQPYTQPQAQQLYTPTQAQPYAHPQAQQDEPPRGAQTFSAESGKSRLTTILLIANLLVAVLILIIVMIQPLHKDAKNSPFNNQGYNNQQENPGYHRVYPPGTDNPFSSGPNGNYWQGPFGTDPGSGSDDNNRNQSRIMIRQGADGTMEYSTDGGQTWKEVPSHSFQNDSIGF